MAQKQDAQAGNKLVTSEELDELTAAERRTIDRHSAPTAALVHETVRAEGESELRRGNLSLLLSGIAAGLSIGMSLVMQGLLMQHLPEASWKPLVVPVGYAAGFAIVILGRQQLFTENTLTPILPLLFHKKLSILVQVARLWALVLFANLVATFLFAAFLAKSGVFEADTLAAFAKVSRDVYGHPFWHTVLSGMMAGWLISLMVWILPASGAARPWMIIMMTYLIGVCRLSHSIAGSVDGFYLVVTGEHGLSDYFAQFLIPTVIGNIVGGVALVAVLNYGQVAEEVHE